MTLLYRMTASSKLYDPQMNVFFKHFLVVVLVLAAFDTKLVVAEPSEDYPPYVWQLSEQRADAYPKLVGQTDLAIEYNSLFEADNSENEQKDWLINIPNTLVARIVSPIDYQSDLLVVVVGQDKGFVVSKPSEEDPTYVWQLSEQGPDAYPRMTGETDLIIEYNSLFEADNSEDENNDWLLNMPTSLVARFTSHINIESELLVVVDGEDNGFKDYEGDFSYEGLYVKVLKLEYESDSYSLFGGRYDPAHGIFGYAPIFFGNYSTNIDLYGRIGLGASVTLAKQENWKHTLTGHRFYLDTSRLSGEVINIRGRNKLDDGDAGNTEELNNYLITLNGGSIGSTSRLNYTLGFGKQIGHLDGLKDEYIGLSSLSGIIQLENDAELMLSVDILSLRNVDGTNEKTESATLGIGYSNWPFYIGTAYSRRFVEPADVGDPNRVDRIIEIVWRYGLGELYFLEGAYQWVEENGTEENSIGLALIYSFDWLVH